MTDDSCSAVDPPAPTDAAAESTSYPEKPDELTRESVGSFVEAYERAYQYNSTLAEYPDKIGRLNDLDISVNEVTVTVEDGVFAADISGQANTGITVDDDTESQTQTPLPIGHRPFESAYTVSDRFVRREGIVYECWWVEDPVLVETKPWYGPPGNVAPMDCDKCGSEAVMHAAYSGAHLCDDHFRASVEKRMRRRIREDDLLPADASPDDPETWVIGLSGGKDSVVLTHVLAETFGRDPRVDLVALSIHEGIEGYRDESLDACRTLTDDLDLQHEVVSYADELGVRMDDVVEKDPENMAACAYCGVFRRDLLESYADELGADKLLTGHNLDDEAQTALMNFFEGDLQQMAKHFDASLGPFDRRAESAHFVPRAKPLRDIPEKEVALYAHLADLPAHITECPHASEAYRGEIQQLLLEMEEHHPGTRHSIMAGYEELAELAAQRYRDDGADDLGECERCGSSTGGRICRKCRLVESIEAV